MANLGTTAPLRAPASGYRRSALAVDRGGPRRRKSDAGTVQAERPTRHVLLQGRAPRRLLARALHAGISQGPTPLRQARPPPALRTSPRRLRHHAGQATDATGRRLEMKR